MQRSLVIVGAATVAALLGALGYNVVMRGGGEQFAQCRDSAVAGGAGSIGGPFELVSQFGATVTDAEVFIRPSLVYFGYTFCPDVCPLDVQRNVIAVEILQERGIDVQPVFVSVDPLRDTPEILASWADFMHPDMVALTGTEEQVHAAASAYRVYYQAHRTSDEEQFYLVDHSTFTYLVLPGYGFVEYYPRNASPQQLAQGAECFVREM